MRHKCPECAAPFIGPCVPVSITETQRCPNETNIDEMDTIPFSESVLDLAESINCLIDAGYKLGCDGELLPPKWAYEAFKRADA